MIRKEDLQEIKSTAPKPLFNAGWRGRHLKKGWGNNTVYAHYRVKLAVQDAFNKIDALQDFSKENVKGVLRECFIDVCKAETEELNQ